ncbi:MAG: DUF4292 domain-containing protein [Bacteroidota bacterium]
MKAVKIISTAVVCALLLAGCKGQKPVVGTSAADASLSAAAIIATHEAASPNFNTLASRVQVVYQDEKKEQSITVSLRMEKDKTIWVKASVLGITLAKAIITPDRVSYYETLSNSYFDGDFALLSDWLGTELDFQKTQAILLGQSIFSLNKNSYRSMVADNKYRLEPKQQPTNFIHSLLLNPDDFKVNSGRLTQPIDQRELSLRYGPYQELNGSKFPSEIFIRSMESGSKTNIDVRYKKIDLDVNLSFNFKIPDGYEEIELNR